MKNILDKIATKRRAAAKSQWQQYREFLRKPPKDEAKEEDAIVRFIEELGITAEQVETDFATVQNAIALQATVEKTDEMNAAHRKILITRNAAFDEKERQQIAWAVKLEELEKDKNLAAYNLSVCLAAHAELVKMRDKYPHLLEDNYEPQQEEQVTWAGIAKPLGIGGKGIGGI